MFFSQSLLALQVGDKCPKKRSLGKVWFFDHHIKREVSLIYKNPNRHKRVLKEDKNKFCSEPREIEYLVKKVRGHLR